MSELTAAQRKRLNVLAAVAEDDPPEFDRDVAAYIFERQPGEEAIFRHPALLVRTFDALNRLIGVEDTGVSTARPGTPARARHAKRREALTREMAVVRPLAKKQTSEGSVRRRAERVVGKVRFEDLRSVMRALEGGMSAADAERQLRAEIAAREKS